MPNERFVGADASKAWLDVAGRPEPGACRVANDPGGIADLVRRLLALAPALAVLEATGGLVLPPVAARQAAGLPVAVVNPRQTRDFARVTGQRARTDRLDAALLARFAEAIRPAAQAAAPEEARHLDALLTRRNQLIAMRLTVTDRLDRLADKAVRAEVNEPVAWLSKAIGRAGAALAEAVKATPAWQAKDALLQSAPGVGPVDSRALLAGPLSWAPPPAVAWRRWPAWPRSRTTAARARAGGASGAAGRLSAGRCTWPRCRRWPTNRPRGRSRSA